MDKITTSGSIEELKGGSKLIIYIVGLILLIIWKVTMICQVRLHLKHNRLEKLVESIEATSDVQNRIPYISSLSLILIADQYG